MRLFCLQLEASCLQWSFLLTVDNFTFFSYNWSFFAYGFSFFTYSWSFFAYIGKVRLIRALRDCKQGSSTVSKKARTVSTKASPILKRMVRGDLPCRPQLLCSELEGSSALTHSCHHELAVTPQGRGSKAQRLPILRGQSYATPVDSKVNEHSQWESLVHNLSGTGDSQCDSRQSQCDSRESIRANHSQSKPIFIAWITRFARITRIADSRESRH